MLWLGDGSRCALLQGDVEPLTKWESRVPKPFLYSPASEKCYTSHDLDLGDALRQLASNFSAPTKEPSLRGNSLVLRDLILRRKEHVSIRDGRDDSEGKTLSSLMATW